MDPIRIGTRSIGDFQPCFIIAEIGVNHNGDPDLAKRLIDVAKDAGADAVKFQTFRAEGVVTSSTKMADYQEMNIGERKSQLEMLRALELDYSCFPVLERYCQKKGLVFLSTPHSLDAIDFLNNLVPAFKVSSSDLTNTPALKEIARTGKPILLSTGMAKIDEIDEAVRAIKSQGNDQIVLLQCISNYPSGLEVQNLRTIRTLREHFNLLTGYSDHTIGELASVIAVSIGACVIEKHITLDRSLPGPDHRASIEPEDFKKLVGLIREVETALGDGIKKPTLDEIKIARVARKSLVAKTDIPKGATITREMIDIKRPQTGISPKEMDNILGRKTKIDIRKDQVIQRSMIE